MTLPPVRKNSPLKDPLQQTNKFIAENLIQSSQIEFEKRTINHEFDWKESKPYLRVLAKTNEHSSSRSGQFLSDS